MKKAVVIAVMEALIVSLSGCSNTDHLETIQDRPSIESAISEVKESTAPADVSSGTLTGGIPADPVTQPEASNPESEAAPPETEKPAEKETETSKAETPTQSAPPEKTTVAKETPSASRTEPAQTPSAPAEPPRQEAASEPQQKTEPSTLPWVERPPKSFTQADHERIISEVTAYAESYREKGFTFEWMESMEFGWDVGYMGTPRINRDGVDGVIEMLEYHIDKIVSTSTDPANGITTEYMTYKVVQIEIDGGIAYAVIYGG